MILYLLPILDLLTAGVLSLHTYYGLLPQSVVLVHGSYLSLKGVLFSYASNDFASKVDFICGVYIVLVALDVFANTAVTLAVLIWLVQKAVFSFTHLK